MLELVAFRGWGGLFGGPDASSFHFSVRQRIEMLKLVASQGRNRP
jgi:hypothetical protein